MITFEIVSRPRRDAEWSSDGLGEPNRFASWHDGLIAVEELRRLGPEWERAEYGVRIVGEQRPIVHPGGG